jgi:hypothetical protein
MHNQIENIPETSEERSAATAHGSHTHTQEREREKQVYRTNSDPLVTG